MESLASERRGRVSSCVVGKGVCVALRTYRREGVYVCVLPCLCRRKEPDAMYRRVEIAREEGCRALREKSTKLRRS